MDNRERFIISGRIVTVNDGRFTCDCLVFLKLPDKCPHVRAAQMQIENRKKMEQAAAAKTNGFVPAPLPSRCEIVVNPGEFGKRRVRD